MLIDIIDISPAHVICNIFWSYRLNSKSWTGFINILNGYRIINFPWSNAPNKFGTKILRFQQSH